MKPTEKGARKGIHPGNAGRTYPPEALTQDEVLALLEQATKRRGVVGIRNKTIMVVLWRTGLRISECLALMQRDIDFENNSLNVLRGRGGKRRTVGVDDWTLEQIKAWLAVRKAPMGAPLFCTRDGKPMYATYVRAFLRQYGEQAGVDKRIHPHMFRHTFAAELAREGVPAAYIQRQLGHSSLSTTTRYLQTLAPTDVIDAIKARPTPWADKEGTPNEEAVS